MPSRPSLRDGQRSVPSPFDSSWRKVARAKKHIADLEGEVSTFVDSDPYLILEEHDPNVPGQKTCKLKPAKILPVSIADIAADAIHNLRDSLDAAGYSIAVTVGVIRPKHTAFPFGCSAIDFRRNMKGRSKDIPVDVRNFIETFQPYRGGNDFLWALNDLCNTIKHGTGLVAVGFGSVLGEFGISKGKIIDIPLHTWNSAKQEIVLGTFSADAKYDMELSPYIAFDEPSIIQGQPLVGTLNVFVDTVEGILRDLRSECLRLFPAAFS